MCCSFLKLKGTALRKPLKHPVNTGGFYGFLFRPDKRVALA